MVLRWSRVDSNAIPGETRAVPREVRAVPGETRAGSGETGAVPGPPQKTKLFLRNFNGFEVVPGRFQGNSRRN